MTKSYLIISFFISIFLINVFTIIPNVEGATLFKYTDFEDGTLNQLYFNTWMNTGANMQGGGIDDNFAIETNTDFGGTKCFRINLQNGSNIGYWNLTYPSDYNLRNWSLWVRHQAAGYTTIEFWNKTLHNIDYTNSNPFIFIYLDGEDFFYGDWDGTKVDTQINLNTDDNSWTQIGFYIQDNEYTSYYLNGASGGTNHFLKDKQVRNTSYNTNTKIDLIRFDTGEATNDDMPTKYHNLSFDTNWRSYQDYPVCGDAQRGIIGITPDHTIFICGSGNSTPKYLSGAYLIPHRYTITRFDIQLDAAMYEVNPASTYRIKFNDDTNPYLGTEWFTLAGNRKILSFQNLNVVINGTLKWIMDAQYPYTGNCYWAIHTSNRDINRDGNRFWYAFEITQHGLWSDWNNYCENIYETWLPYHFSQTREQDLIYRMCITSEEDIDISKAFSNYIHCYPSTVKQFCEQVAITFTVNSTALGLPINIIIDDGTTTETFKQDAQSGTLYYTPEIQGSYWANLSINSVTEATDTFTSSGTCLDYIYTKDNPSKSGESFNIRYKYSKTTYHGRIRIMQGDMQIEKWDIDTNSEGNISYVLYDTGVYHLYLSIRFRNTTNNDIASTKHTVTIDRMNHIAFIGNDFVVNDLVNFYGTHNNLGQNVRIKIGNNYVASVGHTDYFNLFIRVTQAGVFPVQLVLSLDDTDIILATARENIRIADTQIGGEGEGVLPDVSTEIGAILGVILTFGFLMLPFFLQLGANKSIKVPTVAYAMSGGLGITLSIAFGFFDMWVAFFLIAIGVIIVAGIYIKSTFLSGS